MYTTEKPPLDELMHYGVKGMKRGVRKKETPQQKRARQLHERVQREQGRTPGTKLKSASAPPGVAKKMQKLQSLKSTKLSQLNKRDERDMSPKAKLDAIWKKPKGSTTRADVEFMLKNDPNYNDGGPKRPRDAEMVKRLRKNPNDAAAKEYLFS